MAGNKSERIFSRLIALQNRIGDYFGCLAKKNLEAKKIYPIFLSLTL